ncbi:hypothetical protein KOR42_49630 [Thalassoglobus neptunius]|uniref:Uncharacterized protein n=1 Tax=Thalassoglobus neptunius TaxID=1938619 RepID=A0A5C5VQV1_9PLAN|nr:hypothetical protein KOR42_49630 [Thalassoglobus neptunius]
MTNTLRQLSFKVFSCVNALRSFHSVGTILAIDKKSVYCDHRTPYKTFSQDENRPHDEVIPGGMNVVEMKAHPKQ